MTKPHILVARAIFPETLARLAQQFEVEANPDDAIWTKAQLIERLQGKVGPSPPAASASTPSCWRPARNCAWWPTWRWATTTSTCRPAAAGVLATNTPDVLTETTADFGFALMMATARRMTESEHFLRAGRMDEAGATTCSPAPRCTAATLGILGMGRIGQAIARRGALGFGMR
jgi:gluconate 2-dehydrogenase